MAEEFVTEATERIEKLEADLLMLYGLVRKLAEQVNRLAEEALR